MKDGVQAGKWREGGKWKAAAGAPAEIGFVCWGQEMYNRLICAASEAQASLTDSVLFLDTMHFFTAFFWF